MESELELSIFDFAPRVRQMRISLEGGRGRALLGSLIFAAMKRRFCRFWILVGVLGGLGLGPVRGQDAAALDQKGLEAQKAGHLDEAVADWTEAIRLNPKDAEAYHHRGGVRDTQHDLEGAIEDDSEAILLNPNFSDAYADRGYARSRHGDLAGAMADYNEAIALNPQDAESYNNRANAESAQDDWTGAINDYNATIRLNPRHAHAYNGRANVCLKEGDLDQAITDYNQALRLDPGYAHAYNGRGLAHLAQGGFKTAVADFGYALQIDPNYAHAYANQAIADYETGQFSEALTNGEKAVELKMGDVESAFFIWLSTAHQPDQRSKADSDLMHFMDLQRLNPWNEDLAHFLLGDMTQEELLAGAASLDPTTARHQLCQAYFYIASKDELSRDKAGADDFFRRCMGTAVRDFTDYMVARGKVMVAVAATSAHPLGPEPDAVWITGQVIQENGVLYFTTDRPVQGNPLGNKVFLGCTQNLAKTMPPLFATMAEKHLTVRLYGYLLHQDSTMAGHTEPLPNVEFIAWKFHMPSDPDVLPPKEKIILSDPDPMVAPKRMPPGP
jgi:tetratricopeptide (TPR) repeat protein